MGDGDGDVHLLGTTKLTGVATANMFENLVFHAWPEIADGKLFLDGPETMMGCVFMHFPQYLLSSLFGEDDHLWGIS